MALEELTKSRILFFDGICNLCNSSVDFFIRNDRKGTMRFAPLQGETARQHLPAEFLTHLSSIVYYRDGKMYNLSSAAIRACMDLGGIWKLSGVFKIVPKFLRDSVYQWIAKNRYVWFGKHEQCRIPSITEREKFLP